MGLTVHYQLAAPAAVTAADARALVMRMRRVAGRFGRQGRVERVHPLVTDAPALRRQATEWLFRPVPGRANARYEIRVWPQTGFMFEVAVGEDCEPLRLGLCRYPATVRYEGRDWRTRLGAGWRLAGFSKTQFASRHGGEHFLRCHRAVVDLLADLRSPGLRVRISDEGDYWPRRSVAALRTCLEEMNGAVAATAGLLKDLAGETGREGVVQSPIFCHPQFERLEARGLAAPGAGVVRAALTAAGERRQP